MASCRAAPAACARTARTRSRRAPPSRSRAGARRRRSVCPPPYEINEETHGHARWSLGDEAEIRLGVRGAGDVEMDPRKGLREFLEKHRGRDRTGGATARVLEVRRIGEDELLVVVEQRKLPPCITG